MEKEIPLSLCASLETTTRVANKKTLLRGFGVPTTNKKRERKKSGEMMMRHPSKTVRHKTSKHPNVTIP
jgi:hypothetical protein